MRNTFYTLSSLTVVALNHLPRPKIRSLVGTKILKPRPRIVLMCYHVQK